MTPMLESDRLLCVPLSLVHLSQEYVGWLNNPVIYKYLDTGGNYTIETLRNYLSEAEKKDIFFWAIHLKINNKHIGNIKIDPVNLKHGWGEYGIMMGDMDEWGKGYAFEASSAIIHYCFETLNLRKINLGVIEENVKAVELYKKLGFTIEGVFKDHIIHNGRYLNSLRMALFNLEYTNS